MGTHLVVGPPDDLRPSISAASECGGGGCTRDAPPPGQEYTGTEAVCLLSFRPFMRWKKSGHSKAFDNLTAKYQADATMLKCHTTATARHWLQRCAKRRGCRCHLARCATASGSKHEEVSKPVRAGEEPHARAARESVRDSIWKVMPKNICIECHKVQGHRIPKRLRNSEEIGRIRFFELSHRSTGCRQGPFRCGFFAVAS